MDGAIQSRSQFTDDPAGQARRWALELQSARDNLRKYHEKAETVCKVFLDEQEAEGERLNLFHANVVTQRALLYGNTPKVDVERRHGDSEDDDARVAGEMMQRLLNTDIERDGDNYAAALRYALEDWSLVDLGVARARYVVETQTVDEQPAQMGPCEACGGAGVGAAQPDLNFGVPPDPEPCPQCQGTGQVEHAPAVPEHEQKVFEDVETDWVYWKDFLYSPCRVWHERRWVAFRAQMTRDAGVKRFGDIFKRVPLKESAPDDKADAVKDAWSRAEVWEIWSKEDDAVYWYVEGFHQILDVKPDPLGLEGFFPCPRPLVDNATTSKLVPKPSYLFAQDLYRKIDVLYSRICDLEDALRVSGVFDETCAGVGELLDGSARNKLIPVKNWMVFAEKGGIEGRISWFPVEVVAMALDRTQAQLLAKIALLFQTTGMSDIMRGQAAAPATATEQRIKAGFVSARSQTAQDELARFASDLQRLRGEVISKHFDAQTIIDRSNVMRTADGMNKEDPGLPMRAAELPKSQFVDYRIVVRPESISLPDLAQQKQEGVEFLQATTGFMAAMQPVAMQAPTAVPYMLEILKWAMSKFRGASSIEGVLDRALAEAQKPRPPAPPPPPDPRVLAQQEKAKVDVQKAQLGMQATKVQTAAKVIGAVADIARTRAKAAMMPMQAGPMQPLGPTLVPPPGPPGPFGPTQ